MSWHLVLPKELRDELRVPLGNIVDEDDLIKEIKNCKYVLAVGDEVTMTCRRKNVKLKMCVVDFKTKRQYDDSYRLVIDSMKLKKVVVKNPPGNITSELWECIENVLKSEEKICIVVDGEEDLASLPCIVLAENGSCVIYGMPNKGIVVVHVDEFVKKIVNDFLERMDKRND